MKNNVPYTVKDPYEFEIKHGSEVLNIGFSVINDISNKFEKDEQHKALDYLISFLKFHYNHMYKYY